MTKQEGIKELVLKYISEAMLGNHNEDDIESLANSLLLDASNRGVVIKVDRELPDNPYPELARGWFGSDHEANITHYGKRDGYEEAQKDMAGYVSIEPLIEETG